MLDKYLKSCNVKLALGVVVEPSLSTPQHLTICFKKRSAEMKTSRKSLFVYAGIMLVALMFLGGTMGCSKSNGSTSLFGNSYDVAYYRITAEKGSDTIVQVGIKGPAAKLAVIFTNPDGKSCVRIIEKEELISNSVGVELPMRSLLAGKYVLTIKTINPEKIIWKKETFLSSGKLTVENVKFNFTPWSSSSGKGFSGFTLDSIEVVINKEGNLPVKFTDASVAVGGEQCFTSRPASNSYGPTGYTIIEQHQAVNIYVKCKPTKAMVDRDRGNYIGPPWFATFSYGDKYLVKGTLFYGPNRKQLTFEKELIAPFSPEDTQVARAK